MANKDNTRVGVTHEKKSRCLMTVIVDKNVFDEYADASNNYLVGNLPPDALITDAYVFTEVASDAATVTLGTTEGGTEILSAGDTTAPGKSGTFTGESLTGTGKEVHMTVDAAITTGKFIVFIEYSEYDLSTGDLTKVTN